MNPHEALDLLRAARPDGSEDQQPEMQEAWQTLQAHPNLLRQLEQERLDDVTISAKLRSFPVPTEAIQSILTSPKIVAYPRPNRSAWYAWAAVLIAGLSLLWAYRPKTPQAPLALAGFRQEAAAFANSTFFLTHKDGTLEKIHGWLEKTAAPAQFVLPEKLQSLQPLGCRTLTMQGQAVALICFVDATPGREIHLFVIRRDALADSPLITRPEMTDHGPWRTAAWTNGDYAFVLASQDSIPDLQRFF